MRPLLMAAVLTMLWAVPAGGQTTYYVDPDYVGGNGAASTPWASLDAAAWKTINTALASGVVTVYFSAREAGSDTNEATTTALAISRTDGSTNLLTLDGWSKYNTNDSTPSWTTYTGTSKFQITADYPVSTGTTAASSYVTLHGFRIIATNGQIIMWWGGNYVTIEDCEGTHGDDATVGPGFYFQATQTEGVSNCPTPSAAESCVAYSNITIQRNYIHHVISEALYMTGCYGQSGCVSHQNILIANNTIGPDLAFSELPGREPDAIDLKDGLRSVTIRGNTIILDADSRMGIIVESNALIERNYVTGAGSMGIVLSSYYHHSAANRDGAVIRNNILIDTGLDATFTWRGGIYVDDQGDSDKFTNTLIANNTIYRAGTVLGGWGINNYGTNTTVTNNLIALAGTVPLLAAAGTLAAHSHNSFYQASGNLVTYGASSYTAANLTDFEATGLSTDPLFVSTAAPYAALNFALASVLSPAYNSGATIGSFSNDYSGNTRSGTWDRGALEFGAGVIPNAPTGVRIR